MVWRRARVCSGALQAVWRLQETHRGYPAAVAWYNLQSLVDAISPSVHTVDAAYFALEELHKQARRHPPARQDPTPAPTSASASACVAEMGSCCCDHLYSRGQ